MYTRKPAVAGLFYPGNPVELAKTIAGFFAEVDKPPVDGQPIALVAPHAGYPYSGKIAAQAYKQIEGAEFETVVIVSPSHTVFFKGASVFDGAAYATPLGEVPVDQELCERMSTIGPAVFRSDQGHATGSTRGEHALEVQLPFLQVVLGDRFKLVPIVMGDQEEDTIGALGEVMASALQGRNCLMVASTDMSHFHSDRQARRLDSEVRRAIEKFEPATLLETLETGKGEACGGGPVAAVMTAARRLGAKRIQVLGYGTSASTSGDFDNVVGYLSAVILSDKKAATAHATMGSPAARRNKGVLTDEVRELLLETARKSIQAKFDRVPYEVPDHDDLEEKRGAFVTLTIGGDLRGCIGQIRSRLPLGQAVAEMAQAAAFEDPRFPPLTEAEFANVDLEISVLTPLQRVHKVEDIEVGRDGLMIKLDLHSGLLLPQVATEHGWDRMTFLEQTCLKAGLPKSSYQDRHAEIYRFQAQII